MPFDGANVETVSPVLQMLSDGRTRVELGWCQQSMRQRGSVCMIGSLVVADFDTFTQAEGLVLTAIHTLGYDHRSIPEFNDDLDRTKEEVLEVFDTAIYLSGTTS
jgi:hypothetical protein